MSKCAWKPTSAESLTLGIIHDNGDRYGFLILTLWLPTALSRIPLEVASNSRDVHAERHMSVRSFVLAGHAVQHLGMVELQVQGIGAVVEQLIRRGNTILFLAYRRPAVL